MIRIYNYSKLDFTVNKYIKLEEVEKGMQLRIEGIIKDVDNFLNLFEYETVEEGHEEKEVKRVYIKIKKLINANKGYKATIEFEMYNTLNKYEKSVEIYGDNKRYLSVTVNVKGLDEEKTQNLFYELAEIMENEIDYKFSTCPWSERYESKKDDTIIYEHGDCMDVPFEMGEMGEIKKDIKEAFKLAKKQLGIK